MSVNKVILVGNLGGDPELRYTQTGVPLASWAMATNRRYKDKEGNEIDDTQWHNVKAWRGLAETCEKYLSKGRQVYVEGRMETRKYDQDGVTKYWTEVVAETVRFLGRAGNGSSDSPTVVAPPEGFHDEDIPF